MRENIELCTQKISYNINRYMQKVKKTPAWEIF